MGILEQHEPLRRFTLGNRCLLGRHPACDIRLDEGHVSGEHASLHWLGDSWELRDLGSRNGTFLEGRRLDRGGRAALLPGQSFLLGNRGTAFRLVEAGPPAARARNTLRQEVREAMGSLLSLPDDEAPLASIYRKPNGQWVLDVGGFERQVTDHERVTLADEEWVLELPMAAQATIDEETLTLKTVLMKIGVSRDEEHVFVTVEQEGQRHELAPRSYHYLLATLARERLKEAHLPESERGWVEREKLCRMLAMDGNKLNVDIHRVRKQLSALGVLDAAGVIERRPGSGQVRLGVSNVEVFSL